MFHTERMQKIRVFGLHSEKSGIVSELHRLGVIDLRKSALELSDDAPADILPQISELVVRYNSAKAVLEGFVKKEKSKVKHQKEAQPKTAELLRMAREFKAVGEIAELNGRRADPDSEIARLKSERATASLFLGSGIDFSQLKSEMLGFVAYFLGPKVYKNAGKEIVELGRKYEVIENRLKGGFVVFIAYAKDDAAALEKFEHAPGVRKLDITGTYMDSTAEKIVERIDKQIGGAMNEKKEITARLQRYAHDDYNRVCSILEMLLVEAERASVSIDFKRTDSTFILEGWVEKKRVREVASQLESLASGRVEVEEISAKEVAPTLMGEKGILKPFAKIVEFFSLPRSDELDPTFVFMLCFPVFYGLMVSDVGYGLLSFAFAYLICKVTDPDDLLYNVAKVWQISSVAIIFFGFLSNQYFGLQLNQYFTSFTGFDWIKNSLNILAITIYFGMAQVILGLVFSFVNNWHHGHKKVAVSKITSIVLIIAGTLAIGGSIFHAFDATTTQVSTYVMLAMFAVTLYLSGSEATEVVSLVSHPLSYARIMGFGLASVILGLLIDRGFTPHLSSGLILFVPTLIIFILLHFVNMILGTFEGLVQGVRLNFVEFFSKFYTGGGVKFRPFSYRRRYTKEV